MSASCSARTMAHWSCAWLENAQGVLPRRHRFTPACRPPQRAPASCAPVAALPAGPEASAFSCSSSTPPPFDQLYSQLSAVLAPGGAVAAAATPLGRGLVAVQDVPQGSTLLSVDWANLLCVTDQPKLGNAFGRRVLEDWQLLHGRLPPLLVRYLLADEGDWFVRLAAWLLWLKGNAQGPWRLYIDLLPRESDMTCLMNYRPEEVTEFQIPVVEARARYEREQIGGLHDRLFSSTSGELKALQLALQPEDTVWAACMVNSRCFSDTIDGETVSLMVPCADMANHVLAPNAGYQFVAAQDAFQLHALKGIAAGGEACISYGCTHKSNEELMRDYGFVIPGNLNDRVPFSAGDDVASQLAARSAAAAAAGGGSGTLTLGRPSLSAPRLLVALGLLDASGPGSRGFDLTAAAAAVMGDSEWDARQRRLLAAVLSLQPFLRDIAPPTPASGSGGSSGAAAVAGAPPPLTEDEVARERQSVAVLQAQCQQLLARMPTTAETDEELLAADNHTIDANGGSSSTHSGSGGEPLGVRRRQAVATRLEHKRLIQAAADTLQRYAAQLT